MKQLGRVPISVKLLLSPLTGLVLTAVLVVIFLGFFRDHQRVFEEIESRELPAIVELSGLAGRLASVHARIYALLIGPEERHGQEALFLAVRPLLFDLHRIEEELRALAPDDATLSGEVEAYRKRSANAVLSSAVSMASARRELTIATAHFNAANSLIAKRIESSQKRLGQRLQAARHAAQTDLQRFFGVAAAAVLATLTISLLVSGTLSRGIRRLSSRCGASRRGTRWRRSRCSGAPTTWATWPAASRPSRRASRRSACAIARSSRFRRASRSSSAPAAPRRSST